MFALFCNPYVLEGRVVHWNFLFPLHFTFSPLTPRPVSPAPMGELFVPQPPSFFLFFFSCCHNSESASVLKVPVVSPVRSGRTGLQPAHQVHSGSHFQLHTVFACRRGIGIHLLQNVLKKNLNYFLVQEKTDQPQKPTHLDS